MRKKRKFSNADLALFLVMTVLCVCITLIVSNLLESGFTDERVKIIYWEMSISFVISYLIALGYWLHSKHSFIEASRIIGAAFGQIQVHIWRKMAVVFGAGIMTGGVICLFLSYAGIMTRRYLFMDLVVGGAGFIVAQAILWVSVRTLFKYGNVRVMKLFDAALVVQWAILFVLLIEVGTYYINISTVPWIENSKMGYRFYTLQVDDNAGTIYYEDSDTVYDDVKRVLKELDQQDDFFYMRTDWNAVSAMVDYDVLRNRLNNQDYRMFTSVVQACNGQVDMAEEPEEMEDGRRYVNLAVCQMDQNAAKLYVNQNQMEKGRTFGEQDFQYSFDQESIPVLLGHEYERYYQIGDEIEDRGFGKLEVIGFLKQNTVFQSDRTLEHIHGAEDTLDYYIIMPIFEIKDTPENAAQEEFMMINYFNFDSGTVVLPGDCSESQVLSAQKKINQIFRENHLNATYCVNASPAVEIFKLQSAEYVNVLFCLMIIMVVFNIFSMGLNIFIKLEYNMKKYGIQLMNGRSIVSIIGGFAGRITLLILCAAMIGFYFVRHYIYGNGLFAVLLGMECGFCLLLSIVILMYRLAKTDVDMLVRRYD